MTVVAAGITHGPPGSAEGVGHADQRRSCNDFYRRYEQADRAFLRDVLEIPCIDSGGGWLIFKLPPAELGVHAGENSFHQVYFICDDADAFVSRMAEKGVESLPISEEDWGRSTGVKLPGGGTLGVYEARHARP